MTDDKIISKIQALLTKAEDKGATPEEAEAFYGKAQALMTKYAIDQELLRQAGKVERDEIVTERVKVKSIYKIQLVHLFDQVARANDCTVFYTNYDNASATITVVGYKSDVDQVLLIATSLQLHALRECKRASAVNGAKGSEGFYFRRSFIESFAFRIGSRLKEERATTVETVKTETGSDLLPALVDKRNAVKSYVDDNFSLGKGRAGGNRRHSYSGAGAGRDAANRADIGHKRVGGSRGALNR